jgi:hypothetical protein
MDKSLTIKKARETFRKRILNSFQYRIFLFLKLPAAFFAGVRVKSFTKEKCEVTVPFKWLSQNPFKSIYFACLAMAAEMSTGLPAMMAIQGYKPGISMLVVKLEADFIKKADKRTVFICEEVTAFIKAVEKAAESGEGVEYQATSIGRLPDGQEVARFTITWSFKQKRKK